MLHAEDIVRMAREAARYRFMRDFDCLRVYEEYVDTGLSPEELDASLDAAMKAKE